MGNMLENIQGLIKSRKQWLEEAENTAELITYLPHEIRAWNASGDVNNNVLCIDVYEVLNEKVDIREILRINGFTVDGAPRNSGYTDTWVLRYKGTIPTGHDVRVDITLKEAPTNCRLIPYQEAVTRYRVECDEVETPAGA